MKISILTNEYPPNVYGGAGVHVEYLTRELARADERSHDVRVLCFGRQSISDDNLDVRGVEAEVSIPADDKRHIRLFDTLVRDLRMAGGVTEADVVHCHTWYSHFAGCLVKHLAGARLVLTTHSLEPHRPWKIEQLGTAYHASRWLEETAYQNADGVIAVSEAMKRDVQALYGVPGDRVRVIHNGIDVEEYSRKPEGAVLRRYGIDENIPFVLFVGRITRQKGIVHLMRALQHLDGGLQVVLCAGAPDTNEIADEMSRAVQDARQHSENPIIWIDRMVPRADVIALYSSAALFVCPSVYEPFGIINLEAMACGTPVVASRVGGIPEVVMHEETGLLVDFVAGGVDAEPNDPDRFAGDLAAAINRLMGDDVLRTSLAARSRERVVEHFSWQSIARQTLAFYRELVEM